MRRSIHQHSIPYGCPYLIHGFNGNLRAMTGGMENGHMGCSYDARVNGSQHHHGPSVLFHSDDYSLIPKHLKNHSLKKQHGFPFPIGLQRIRWETTGGFFPSCFTMGRLQSAHPHPWRHRAERLPDLLRDPRSKPLQGSIWVTTTIYNTILFCYEIVETKDTTHRCPASSRRPGAKMTQEKGAAQ